MPRDLYRDEARVASKALIKETFQLGPSAVISLFEIDLSDIFIDKQIIFEKDDSNELDRILRFHNNNTFMEQRKSIFWRGSQYYPAPFRMTGFETTMQGTIPKPKMALSAGEAGTKAMAILKSKFRELDDLVGAKVTRYKTFAKFLDFENFKSGDVPQGFQPGVNAEFPREIFYIERKSVENKFTIEFELSSNIDVEGTRLPKRIILANRCPWQYRGEGCCYEYNATWNETLHGAKSDSANPTGGVLPYNFQAPPVANEIGHKIADILKIPQADIKLKISQDGEGGTAKWGPNTEYVKGDAIFVEKNGINYYFVARGPVPKGNRPPNDKYWIADLCTKDIQGCKLRFSRDVSVPLRFGGFPSAEKQRQN
tara:strand:+ start:4738 stop:5844 length:1107 start_codon:yes stop_codon:yes gene_type:complete